MKIINLSAPYVITNSKLIASETESAPLFETVVPLCVSTGSVARLLLERYLVSRDARAACVTFQVTLCHTLLYGLSLALY